MVETEKTVVAIEEKEKWESREEDILSQLKELKAEKKKLVKQAKRLKKQIEAIEEASRYIDKGEIDKESISNLMSENIR